MGYRPGRERDTNRNPIGTNGPWRCRSAGPDVQKLSGLPGRCPGRRGAGGATSRSRSTGSCTTRTSSSPAASPSASPMPLEAVPVDIGEGQLGAGMGSSQSTTPRSTPPDQPHQPCGNRSGGTASDTSLPSEYLLNVGVAAPAAARTERTRSMPGCGLIVLLPGVSRLQRGCSARRAPIWSNHRNVWLGEAH
jgi:hypothetical protein